MGIREIAEGKGPNSYPVKPENLHEGVNLRIDFTGIEDLAEDIKTNGQRMPIMVQYNKSDNKLYVVDGARRLRAIKYANEHLGTDIKTVRCNTVDNNMNEMDVLASQFSYNSGCPFTLWEEIVGVNKFVKWGWTQNQIADKVGKSVTWVIQRKTLNNAGPQLQKAIQEKVIGLTHAINIIEKADGKIEKENELVSKFLARKENGNGNGNGRDGASNGNGKSVQLRSLSIPKLRKRIDFMYTVLENMEVNPSDPDYLVKSGTLLGLKIASGEQELEGFVE